jgi:hypothetical protein
MWDRFIENRVVSGVSLSDTVERTYSTKRFDLFFEIADLTFLTWIEQSRDL